MTNILHISWFFLLGFYEVIGIPIHPNLLKPIEMSKTFTVIFEHVSESEVENQELSNS